MLFGNNNVVNPGILALFSGFAIGDRLQIGVNAGNWIGNLAGFENNVVVLNNAQLFGNGGAPIEGARPIARVPLNLITFVSEAPEARPPKPHKKGKGKKVKEFCKKCFKKICKVKEDVCEGLEKFGKSVQESKESAEEFLNHIFDSDSANPMDNKEEKNKGDDKKKEDNR